MIEDNEKTEVADSLPETAPRFTPLVVVSMLFGFVLCLGMVAAYLAYGKIRSLQGDIVAVREEVKKKNAALQDRQEQIEALSRQISALKEHSVARSRNNATPREAIPPVGSSSPATSIVSAPGVQLPGIATKPGAGIAVQPRKKKAQPETENCELVGKSPEEQAATLKRCVSVMDGIAGSAGRQEKRR